MIDKKLEKAFNVQLVAETYSAYLYWSMSAYFESINLKGFANWMRVQAREEMVHYDYYDKAKFRTDEEIKSFVAALRRARKDLAKVE